MNINFIISVSFSSKGLLRDPTNSLPAALLDRALADPEPDPDPGHGPGPAPRARKPTPFPPASHTDKAFRAAEAALQVWN